MYLLMCRVQLEDPAVEEDRFRRFFLPALLQATLDPVSNVRLSAAKVLLRAENPGGCWLWRVYEWMGRVQRVFLSISS
jgi:hypothetical protein